MKHSLSLICCCHSAKPLTKKLKTGYKFYLYLIAPVIKILLTFDLTRQ